MIANRADLFAQAQVDSLRAGGFHPLLLSSRVFAWAPGQQSSGKGKNCCLFLCLGQQYLKPHTLFFRSNLTILLIAFCYDAFIQQSHFHTRPGPPFSQWWWYLSIPDALLSCQSSSDPLPGSLLDTGDVGFLHDASWMMENKKCL